MTPSFLAVIRIGVAFMLLSPLLGKIKHWSWELMGQSFFLGSIGFAIPIWLQIIGLSGTDPAIAAISVSLEPLLTILLAALFMHVRVPWWQKTALLLAVIGSWILTGEPRPGHLAHLGGDMALFLSVLCFALYNVYSPALSKRVDAGPAAALSFGFGTVGSAVIWLVDKAPLPAAVTGPLLLSTGFMAVFATGLAYLLWLYVVSRHSITLSALFLFVQPLLGTLLSYVLGQSPLTLSLVGGGLLILIAMTLGQETLPFRRNLTINSE